MGLISRVSSRTYRGHQIRPNKHYFLYKKMFGFLRGSNDNENQDNQNSGRHYVSILVDRLKSSHIIDDRRDAIRSIKALSRKYKSEVLELGFDTILIALKNDINDNELVGYCLDILYNLIENEEATGSRGQSLEDFQRLTAEELDENTNMMIVNCDAITPRESALSIAIDLLQNFEFSVRYPA